MRDTNSDGFHDLTSEDVSKDTLDELVARFTVLATCPSCSMRTVYPFQPGHNNSVVCKNTKCDEIFKI